jgi:hypothetical protein
MPCSLSHGKILFSKEGEKIVELLLAAGGDKRHKARAADELLERGGEAFESLFQEPPLGPIPDYLKPYTLVQGCVAEYEEKYEELDRWKVQKLEMWLKDKVGKKFTSGEKVYELSRESAQPDIPDRYWLKRI